MKTGITAGWGGATGHFGVQPDLVALAKSIGGGLPIGAFGGRAELMDEITRGTVLHLGTYNGNPLVMAASRAVLRDICTPEATQDAIARNARLLAANDRIIADAACRPTPSNSARRAASPTRPSGSATTATTRPPTSTSRSPTGSGASTVASSCRRGSTSSGLISVMHTDADVDHATQVFADFVSELVR